VIAGATATEALVIAAASPGCFATVVAAAIAAISGSARLTAPTTKGALPGFMSSAARTASLVTTCCSSNGASLIHFTTKSGTSGAGVLLSIFLNELTAGGSTAARLKLRNKRNAVNPGIPIFMWGDFQIDGERQTA